MFSFFVVPSLFCLACPLTFIQSPVYASSFGLIARDRVYPWVSMYCMVCCCVFWLYAKIMSSYLPLVFGVSMYIVFVLEWPRMR